MANKKDLDKMFLNSDEKESLIEDMVDRVDSHLNSHPANSDRITEYWNLHEGIWPEMDDYLNDGIEILGDFDSNLMPSKYKDSISHHGKINNVTNYLLGDIITQPFVYVIKDFSSKGRKERETMKVGKLQEYYKTEVYAKKVELIRSQYFEEIGNPDPMSLSPEEQKQVQADLQKRIKQGIPKEIQENIKKTKSPEELIRAKLLAYDIEAYDIKEKFIDGGEQALIASGEMYRIGKKRNKPFIDVLDRREVTWLGTGKSKFVEDGIMAKHQSYISPHEFIDEFGMELAKNKELFNNVKELFTEIPRGSFHHNSISKGYYHRSEQEKNLDQLATDLIGADPTLITEDWRTFEGQQQIRGLYNSLYNNWVYGHGIKKSYNTFKWTETVKLVYRENESGGLDEFILSGTYIPDPSVDIEVYDYPISRTYEGTIIADKYFMGCGAVDFQYYGNPYDWQPKLRIMGKDYTVKNGRKRTPILEPAITYQLRYNLSASKLEELERSDKPVKTYWNMDAKPPTWTDEEYMESVANDDNVPFSSEQIDSMKGGQPFYETGGGANPKMQQYAQMMEKWERDLYESLGVNKDTLGRANQYQSNALTQSNIRGSVKQLLPFYNSRREVKQRVINEFNNVSMMCFLDDEEKQHLILNDYLRNYLRINKDHIRSNNAPIFVVDDFGDQEMMPALKQHLLKLFHVGMNANDIIRLYKSKSMQEMEEVADDITNRIRQENENKSEAERSRAMQELNVKKEWEMFMQKLQTMSNDRKYEVMKYISDNEASINERAADINQNKIADSLEKVREEIASEEKLRAKDRALKDKLESRKLDIKEKEVGQKSKANSISRSE